MSAFTAMGVLWFWMICFEIGRLIGVACDAKRCWDEFTKPVDDGIAEVMHAIAIWDVQMARAAKATGAPA